MIFILGITLVLASAVSAGERDYNLFDRHCVGKLNGFKYQSPHDCSEFFTCMNEGAWMYMCPDGLYFDEQRQSCEDSKKVVCHQVQSFPACTSKTAGTVVEHDDCTKFYICNNNIWKTAQCEDGLSFVKEQGTCQWLQNEKCLEANFRRKLALTDINLQPIETTHMDSRCAQSDTLEAQHLAHPTSCSKFFKCYLGKAFLEHCPSGLHFSVALDRCEDIETAKCQVDRFSHNWTQDKEKKQKHGGKVHNSERHAALGAPKSEQKLPLIAVPLPPSVELPKYQVPLPLSVELPKIKVPLPLSVELPKITVPLPPSVELPKDIGAEDIQKPVLESEKALEALKEYLNHFFSALHSPNLLDVNRPVEVKPEVKEEEEAVEEKSAEEMSIPLEPFMVIPAIPDNTVQYFERPIEESNEEAPVKPQRTVPIPTVDPVEPIVDETSVEEMPVEEEEIPVEEEEMPVEEEEEPQEPQEPQEPFMMVPPVPESSVVCTEIPSIRPSKPEPVVPTPIETVDPIIEESISFEEMEPDMEMPSIPVKTFGNVGNSKVPSYRPNGVPVMPIPILAQATRPVRPLKKETVVEEMPFGEESEPLEPSVDSPFTAETVDEDFELPVHKFIEEESSESFEPFIQQTRPIETLNPVRPVGPYRPMPVQTINPVGPAQTLPAMPIHPHRPINPNRHIHPNRPIINPNHMNPRPNNHKKPGKPRFKDFANEKEYFDSLFEYYYPAHSNPVGNNRRQQHRQPHRQQQGHQNQNANRPMNQNAAHHGNFKGGVNQL